MSVTAVSVPAMTADSRNADILAEARAIFSKPVDDFDRQWNSGKTDDEIRKMWVGRFLERAAYSCGGMRCRERLSPGGRDENGQFIPAVYGEPHVFQAGEKVARYRMGAVGGWKLVTRCAVCENIAANAKGILCDGGCGLYVVTYACHDPRRWGPVRQHRTSTAPVPSGAQSAREPNADESSTSDTHAACGVCGDQFTPIRKDARYCSNACRQDAYRKRKLGAA